MHSPKLESITTMLNTDNVQHVIPIYQRKFVWAETKTDQETDDTDDTNIVEGTEPINSKKNKSKDKKPKLQKKDRIDNLFKFIEEIADGKTNAPTNFIGFMVNQSREAASAIKMNKFQVIDGQQRFTTISLLLISISKICKEEVISLDRKLEIINSAEGAKNQDEINRITQLIEFFKNESNEIMKNYIFHDVDPKSDIKDKLRFVPSRHNIDAYVCVIEDKLIEASDEVLNDTVVTAFNKLTYLCRNYLKPSKKEEIKKEKLRPLLSSIKSLKVALLELTDRDDAQQIFESINNRGMKLTGFDLIRNDLFSLDSESIDIYEKRWKPIEEKFRTSFNEKDDINSQRVAEDNLFNYVRCLLLKDGDYISKNDVFVTFKNKYSTREAKMKFIDLFCKLHNDYLVLANPENTQDRRSALVDASKRLKNIEFSSPFALILNLIESNEKIEDISNVIKVLEIYYVRRQLANLSVKKIPEIIMKLCKEYKLNRVNNIPLVDWFKEILILDQEKEPANKRFYNYPTDLEIRTSLKSLDAYTQCSEIVSHIYLTLNEIQMGRNNFNAVDRTEQQLDHIMPQEIKPRKNKDGSENNDPTYNWVKYLDPKQSKDIRIIEAQHQETNGLIGNLTLSGKNSNSSNKIYPEKIKDLKDSPFPLTRSVAEHYKAWDFQSIEKRTDDVINLIVNTGFPNIDKITF